MTVTMVESKELTEVAWKEIESSQKKAKRFEK